MPTPRPARVSRLTPDHHQGPQQAPHQDSARWEPAKHSPMGTLSGIGHPLFFCPTFRAGNLIGHAPGGTGPANLFRARVERIVPSIGSPFWERGWGCSEGPDQYRDGESDAVGWPYATTSERFRRALSAAFLSPSGPNGQRPFEARYVSALLGLLVLGKLESNAS